MKTILKLSDNGGNVLFDTKLTAHLAALSKLEFSKEELARITEEMDSIVALMDTVSEFNYTGEHEITSPVSLSELRDDNPTDSMDREAILKMQRTKVKHSSRFQRWCRHVLL